MTLLQALRATKSGAAADWKATAAKMGRNPYRLWSDLFAEYGNRVAPLPDELREEPVKVTRRKSSPRGTKHQWTAAEEARLREIWASEYSPFPVAVAEIGVPRVTLRAKVIALGLPTASTFWTAEEDAALLSVPRDRGALVIFAKSVGRTFGAARRRAQALRAMGVA